MKLLVLHLVNIMVYLIAHYVSSQGLHIEQFATLFFFPACCMCFCDFFNLNLNSVLFLLPIFIDEAEFFVVTFASCLILTFSSFQDMTRFWDEI